VDSTEGLWQDERERAAVESRLRAAIAGSNATAKTGLEKLVGETGAVVTVGEIEEMAVSFRQAIHLVRRRRDRNLTLQNQKNTTDLYRLVWGRSDRRLGTASDYLRYLDR
jgi:hypothetical protein